MDMTERLNAAVRYVEDNLCGEIDGDALARIACVTQDSFLRFFSYMTGMTLNEYVRRRRLSLAGEEIQGSDARIIDIALKYGYDSADAFARAFVRQHGITPSATQKGGPLKIYPPVSFHIIIKGAKEMDFRMIDVKETRLCGAAMRFDEAEYSSREELRHIMWSEECENVPGRLCDGKWNEPGNTGYDGIWYGVWRDGRYMIAREPECVKPGEHEAMTIPAGRYAAFTTEKGVPAWEAIPKLTELIFDSWLPDSGYALRGDEIIEVYHLWTDHERRRRERYYEIWVPVKEK